ncbi:hypothetical protein CCR75_006767 [Bremia lactucae]|uniref:Uncharacterized protein n=1 Tax=Bremia lactucae TaxID=4779 RepID=A0A976FFQ7_BRELC|nr:hypothetical protein CCR75_006767 [Bremia lactucae]
MDDDDPTLSSNQAFFSLALLRLAELHKWPHCESGWNFAQKLWLYQWQQNADYFPGFYCNLVKNVRLLNAVFPAGLSIFSLPLEVGDHQCIFVMEV